MNWEFSVLDFIQSFHGPVLDKLMAFFTFLGEAGWFWILLCLVLLCSRKYRFCGIALCIALLINLILGNIILKPLVARPRPCWIRDTVEVLIRVPGDYSFPSGHTMASFSAGTALFLTWRRPGICALVLAAVIGFSRLYFYVHCPTDVLAGAVLGILCGILGTVCMKKLRGTKAGKFC